MSRSDEAFREATRDPVFLLQGKRLIWTGMPDGWSTDGESWWPDDGSEEGIGECEAYRRFKDDTHGDYDIPYAIVEWDTVSVALSRAEGEAFFKRQEYNYVLGWRVYCIPCDGKLAEFLKTHDE